MIIKITIILIPKKTGPFAIYEVLCASQSAQKNSRIEEVPSCFV